MAEPANSIDITDIPDLLSLVEEIHRVGEPRILRRGSEDLAMMVPLPRPKRVRRKGPTEADLAAFRSAAGGWKDIDTDVLIKHIYESRRISTRPLVDL